MVLFEVNSLYICFVTCDNWQVIGFDWLWSNLIIAHEQEAILRYTPLGGYGCPEKGQRKIAVEQNGFCVNIGRWACQFWILSLGRGQLVWYHITSAHTSSSTSLPGLFLFPLFLPYLILQYFHGMGLGTPFTNILVKCYVSPQPSQHII